MNFCLIKIKELKLTVHPLFGLFMLLWLLVGLPLETLFLFLLVLGHEFCHTLAARFLGLKVSRVELFPFGGVAHLAKPLELEPRSEMIVAAAGPAFNLVFFLLLSGLGESPHPFFVFPSFLSPIHISFLQKANLFLFFFNLLPALPLDGGRIIRAFLSSRLGFYRATEKAAASGKWLGAFLVIAGLFLFCYDYINLSLSFLGLFLYYAAGREQHSSVYVFLRYLLRKEKELKERKVLRGEHLVALDSTTIMEVLKNFKPSRYHHVVVLSQTCRVMDFLSESQILSAALQKGTGVTLRRLIRK